VAVQQSPHGGLEAGRLCPVFNACHPNHVGRRDTADGEHRRHPQPVHRQRGEHQPSVDEHQPEQEVPRREEGGPPRLIGVAASAVEERRKKVAE